MRHDWLACEQAFGRVGNCCYFFPLLFFPQTESLFTGYDWRVKKAMIDWSIKMKGNSKRLSGNLLSPLGAQNKDLGAASIRRHYLPTLDYVYDAGASGSCIFGQNKLQISQYEKSLSSLFILSRVFKKYSSSFGKFCVFISCCEDIYGRHSIQKSATITSTHNLQFLLP